MHTFIFKIKVNIYTVNCSLNGIVTIVFTRHTFVFKIFVNCSLNGSVTIDFWLTNVKLYQLLGGVNK